MPEGVAAYEARPLEPCDDALAALETSKQPFDLVSPLVDDPAKFPFALPVRVQRHDRRHSQIADRLEGPVASTNAIHGQRPFGNRLVPAFFCTPNRYRQKPPENPGSKTCLRYGKQSDQTRHNPAQQVDS